MSADEFLAGEKARLVPFDAERDSKNKADGILNLHHSV
jgi:hypothetical protein